MSPCPGRGHSMTNEWPCCHHHGTPRRGQTLRLTSPGPCSQVVPFKNMCTAFNAQPPSSGTRPELPVPGAAAKGLGRAVGRAVGGGGASRLDRSAVREAAAPARLPGSTPRRAPPPAASPACRGDVARGKLPRLKLRGWFSYFWFNCLPNEPQNRETFSPEPGSGMGCRGPLFKISLSR